MVGADYLPEYAESNVMRAPKQGEQFVWVPGKGYFRMPLDVTVTPENAQKFGEQVPLPTDPPSVTRGYQLLNLLRQEVQRLYQVDEDAAREVMSEVSTFETDWWGSNGAL